MRILLYALIGIFLIQSPAIYAQSGTPYKLRTDRTYNLSLQVDVPIATVMTGLALTYFLVQEDKNLDFDYINSLDPESINGFDKSAIGKNSQSADLASDIFMYSSAAAPLLLLADKKIRKEWKEYSVITLETFVVAMSLTAISKKVIDRARPSAYDKTTPPEVRAKPDQQRSFFSGHVALTSTTCFLTAKMLTDYHPDTKYKPLIWILASGIPLTTGMLRYQAGEHFFTDVIAGYAVGALSGVFVPYVHKKLRTRMESKDAHIIEFFDGASDISSRTDLEKFDGAPLLSNF